MGFATKHEELQDIETRIFNKTNELNNLSVRVSDAEKALASHTLTQEEILKTKQLLVDLKSEIEIKTKERDDMADQFQQEVKAVQTMRVTKDNLAGLIAADEQTKKQISIEIGTLANQRGELEREIQKSKDQHKQNLIDFDIEIEKKNHQIDTLKAREVSITKTISDKEADLKVIDAKIISGQSQLKSIDDEIVAKKSEVVRLDGEVKEKKTTVASLDKTIQDETVRLDKMTVERNAACQAREDAVTKREGDASLREKFLNEKQDELKRIKNELELFYNRPIPNVRF